MAAKVSSLSVFKKPGYVFCPRESKLRNSEIRSTPPKSFLHVVHSYSLLRTMKVLFQFLIIVLIATVSQAISIRTRVWIKKTGGDQAGPLNELITTVTESGNGQGQSVTEQVDALTNANFGGLGQLLSDQTLSGNKLPTAIMVRVIEDDGPLAKMMASATSRSRLSSLLMRSI